MQMFVHPWSVYILLKACTHILQGTRLFLKNIFYFPDLHWWQWALHIQEISMLFVPETAQSQYEKQNLGIGTRHILGFF